MHAPFGSVVDWAFTTLVTLLPPPTALASTQILTTASPVASSVASSHPSEPTDGILTSKTENSPITMTTRATVTAGTTLIVYKNQTSTENRKSTTSMAIGAGLGAPLGLALFACIGYLLLRNRSRKNAASSRLPQPSMDNKARFIKSPSGPHELIGDVNESELPAPFPVYEI